jgi:subtilisin family serine protease
MPRRRRLLAPTGRLASLACLVAAGAGCAAVHPGSPTSKPVAYPLAAVRPTAAAPAGRFEGDLAELLERAGPSDRFVTLVDLTEQLDLRALDRRLREGGASKSARRDAVIQALEQVALRQQSRLTIRIEGLQATGDVGYVRPVAIVNRLIVEGTAKGLVALAGSPEVAVIRPDWTSQKPRGRIHNEPATIPIPLGESFRSWAIDAIGAGTLWASGIDGTGVVVGSIDTGVFEGHEQLSGRSVPGERGWFDPVEGSSVPSDSHGHGTSVLSVAVGANPSGRIVGVAPGARWCAALGNWRNFYSRSRMTLAADWMLRVGRPDVLVNAWSHDEGPCVDFDRPFIDAWKASGIFVVFPAGNSGPEPSSGEAPAQLSGIFPDGGAVFSVAALSESGRPLPLSSRGPSRCGSAGFPTLAAPGGDLPIAAPGNPHGYVRGDGTSLTAGVVAGAAALLLQAVPEADPQELERALVASARDVDPPGRDDASGAGAIDLPRALAFLRSEVKR